MNAQTTTTGWMDGWMDRVSGNQESLLSSSLLVTRSLARDLANRFNGLSVGTEYSP